MSNVSDEELSQDTLFSLLSNPRRRFALQYLNRVDGPVTLRDLAVEAAAWENETDPDNLTDQQRKRVQVSLYQTHIPALEDAGIIEYDRDSGEITLTNRASDLNVYLHGDIEDQRRWEIYYLALAVAGVILYAASTLVVGVGEFLTAVIGLVWIIGLAGLALAHYAETR
jgi:DNA-binding transcriptional ArsR family regulator